MNTPATDTVHGVGPRTRAYLRAKFDAPRAKGVANALQISVPLANKLLGGYAPRMWLFEEMVALWGSEFLRCIFAEAFAADDQRVADLEREVQTLRAELANRDVAGGLAEGLPRHGSATGAVENDKPGYARIAALVIGLAETIPAKVRQLEKVE